MKETKKVQMHVIWVLEEEKQNNETEIFFETIRKHTGNKRKLKSIYWKGFPLPEKIDLESNSETYSGKTIKL